MRGRSSRTLLVTQVRAIFGDKSKFSVGNFYFDQCLPLPVYELASHLTVLERSGHRAKYYVRTSVQASQSTFKFS